MQITSNSLVMSHFTATENDLQNKLFNCTVDLNLVNKYPIYFKNNLIYKL